MGIKVRVQNFQSLADVTVEIDGFTVITGQNNGGKTALIRAIRGVFTNARNSKVFVRHGSSHATVEVAFPDGQTVMWEKGESVNRYTINGQVLNKVGQGVPDPVLQLGIVPVQVGDKQLWPQIADQMSGQVFLMDQPGSVVAEAIADVERVGRLNQALKASETDRRAAQQKLKIRRQDLDGLALEAQKYEQLDPVLEGVKVLEEMHAKAERTQRAITTCLAFKARLSQYASEVHRLDGVGAVPLPTQEAVQQAQDAAKQIAWLEGVRQRLSRWEEQVEELAGISCVVVPGQAAFQAAQQVHSELAVLEGLRSRRQKAEQSCDRYRGADSLDGLPLFHVDLGQQAQRAEQAVQVVQGLATRRSRALKEIDAVLSLQEHLKTNLALVEGELAKTLLQAGSCPTCGVTVGHQH